MAQATWEKSVESSTHRMLSKGSDRWKFMVGGLLILGVAIYLIVANTVGGARYFITVDELVSNPSYIGETVRISGAVIGESITYNTSDPAKPATPHLQTGTRRGEEQARLSPKRARINSIQKQH